MKKVLLLVSNELAFDQRVQKIGDTLTANNFHVEVLFARRSSSVINPEVGFIQSPIKMIFKRGFGFYLELNHRLFWKGLFKRFDLISAVDVDTLPAACLLKWIKKKPVVLDAHEWYEESPEIIHRKRIYTFWKRLAIWLIPKTDARYTVNDSIADAMEDAYGVSFQTIYNFPRKNEEDQSLTAFQKRTILYQGVLNKDRGLEALIEAMKELKDFNCILVGDGDIADSLKAKVNQSGITDRVTFLGQISPPELRKITTTAWLGYNLLDGESKSYYFSLANKFFDYLSAGIPSLNMNYPEYAKIVSDLGIGILMDSCNSKDIVDTVTKLDQNAGLYETLKSNSVLYAAKYIWENQEPKLMDIYNLESPN